MSTPADPHFRYWTCPRCGAPLQRVLQTSDYHTCTRACDATIPGSDPRPRGVDGWYPEHAPGTKLFRTRTADPGPYRHGAHLVWFVDGRTLVVPAAEGVEALRERRALLRSWHVMQMPYPAWDGSAPTLPVEATVDEIGGRLRELPIGDRP